MSFDFNRFRIEDEPQPVDVAEQAELPAEKAEPFNFEDHRVHEEGMFGYSGRQTVRSGVRVLETIFGTPGDMIRPTFDISGEIADRIGVPESIQQAVRTGVKTTTPLMNPDLPTSGELKAMSSWLTSGFTDPRTQTEEFSDEVIQLGTALAIPAKNPLKFGNLARSLGKAFLAKSAGKLAKEYGAGEVGQLGAETGTLIVTSLLGNINPREAVRSAYDRARGSLRPNEIVDAKGMQSSLQNLDKELSKGLQTSSKTEVRSKISELTSKIQNGNIPADELIESYHDLNELMNGRNLWESLSKSGQKVLKRRYLQLKGAVNDGIKSLESQNPVFGKNWRAANAAHGVHQQTQWSKNAMHKALGEGQLGKTLGYKLLIGSAVGAPIAGAIGAAKTAGTAGILFGAEKIGQAMAQIAQDPTLRRHYMDAFNAMLKENSRAFASAVNKLNKGLKDQEGSGQRQSSL
jgi:thymidylate synthase